MPDQYKPIVPPCSAKSYWTPEGLECEDFQIPPEGLGRDQHDRALLNVTKYLETTKKNFLGYQATQKIENVHLRRFFESSINNIGDPFSNPDPGAAPPDGYFSLNCKWMERAVLDYFARLWHAPYPHLSPHDDHDDEEGWRETYWGYVLSMGSTEGNLVGLRSARDYLRGMRLRFEENEPEPLRLAPNLGDAGSTKKLQPVLFYSSASHYSVRKLADLLELPTFGSLGREQYPGQCPLDGDWPDSVPVDENEAIDLRKLVTLVDFFAEKDHPIAVVFNYGTTFTGAYDDVEEAVAELVPLFRKHGIYERRFRHEHRGRTFDCIRKGFWLHVDGALGAGHVPFLPEAPATEGNEAFSYPIFDFRLDIQSLVVSGHKWLGAPSPCGVFMTRNKYLLTNDVPEYVGVIDSTLAGSRDGLGALLLWDQLARTSATKRGDEVRQALRLAAYAQGRLAQIYGRNKVHRAPGSLAVVFPRPKRIELVQKYALASRGDQSHLFVMRHVTKELIDALLEDLRRELEKEPVSKPAVESLAESRTAARSSVLRGGW